jgi:hypothetical protein
MKNLRFAALGLLCLGFVGCAGSTGGGHVVGNPIVSASEASQLEKRQEGGCGCHHHAKANDHDDGKSGCGSHHGCDCHHDEEGGSCGDEEK